VARTGRSTTPFARLLESHVTLHGGGAVSGNSDCAGRINIERERDLDNYAVVSLSKANATSKTKANVMTKTNAMAKVTARASTPDWRRSVTAARNQRKFGIGQLNQIIHFCLLHVSPRLAGMTR
jgi:hypothetical protein